MQAMLADTVSQMEQELGHLRIKSANDDAQIRMLMDKLQTMSEDLMVRTQGHDEEMRRLRLERDKALAEVRHVSGLVNSICALGVQGLNRLRGTNTTGASLDQATAAIHGGDQPKIGSGSHVPRAPMYRGNGVDEDEGEAPQFLQRR
jgi:hypothetical protein